MICRAAMVTEDWTPSREKAFPKPIARYDTKKSANEPHAFSLSRKLIYKQATFLDTLTFRFSQSLISECN